jgi:hypothetical protein
MQAGLPRKFQQVLSAGLCIDPRRDRSFHLTHIFLGQIVTSVLIYLLCLALVAFRFCLCNDVVGFYPGSPPKGIRSPIQSCNSKYNYGESRKFELLKVLLIP